MAPLSQKDVDELMRQARQFLKEEEPKKALKIGERLEKVGYSGGFEMQALAHAALENKKKAVKILEKGVKTAPGVWLLWDLLGNYYSDLGKFTEAIEAFKKGLGCQYADPITLNYNYALALKRMGDVAGAFDRIQTVFNDPNFRKSEAALIQWCFALLLELLNTRGDFEEAEKVFQKFEKGFKAVDPPEDSLSRIYSDYAFSLWKRDKLDKAYQTLLESISWDKMNEEAQWLLREMYKTKDFSKAKYFQIMVEGKWDGSLSSDGKDSGFFTTYHVVADDEREAMGYIKPFEPEHVRESLKVSESKVLKSEKQPKGVYKSGSYVFFPLEKGK